MTPLVTIQAREYLTRHGPGSLTIQQATALILGSGVHGRSVTVLSAQVAEVLLAGGRSAEDLRGIVGLGPAKVSAIVAALALGRLLETPNLSDVLTSPETIYESCRDLLSEPQEHLVAFFLCVRNRKIRRELISVGTASSSIVHAREVFRAAIVHNAHSLILAHNHPSGDPSPSAADYTVTRSMAVAGQELGIELLDHVICAETGWVSLKESSPTLFP